MGSLCQERKSIVVDTRLLRWSDSMQIQSACSHAMPARGFLPPGAKARGAGAAPSAGNTHPQCTE